jgi:hypothetical protein
VCVCSSSTTTAATGCGLGPLLWFATVAVTSTTVTSTTVTSTTITTTTITTTITTTTITTPTITTPTISTHRSPLSVPPHPPFQVHVHHAQERVETFHLHW